MWEHYYTYLYGYGFLFTLLSIGFYIYQLINSSLYVKSVKPFFKLIFSICSGWLLVIVRLGANGLEPPTNPFLEILYYLCLWVFPVIVFIGLEMMIYGLFNNKDE